MVLQAINKTRMHPVGKLPITVQPRSYWHPKAAKGLSIPPKYYPHPSNTNTIKAIITKELTPPVTITEQFPNALMARSNRWKVKTSTYHCQRMPSRFASIYHTLFLSPTRETYSWAGITPVPRHHSSHHYPNRIVCISCRHTKEDTDIWKCVNLSHLNRYMKRAHYLSSNPAQPCSHWHWEISSIPEHYNRRMDEAFAGLSGYRCIVDNVIIYDSDITQHTY